MPTARQVVAKAYEAQAMTSELARLGDRSVTIASLHTLTLSYVPSLISRLQEQTDHFSASIIADLRSVEDYLISLANGNSDFFICYDHPSVPMGIDHNDFPKLELSRHWIHPYQSLSLQDPELERSIGRDIDYLDYAPATYMARVVDHCLSRAPFRKRLKPVYRASLAESVFTAAQHGLGLAFLPETVAPGTASDYGLVKMSENYSTSVTICIYRSSRNKNPIAQTIWTLLKNSVMPVRES